MHQRSWRGLGGAILLAAVLSAACTTTSADTSASGVVTGGTAPAGSAGATAGASRTAGGPSLRDGPGSRSSADAASSAGSASASGSASSASGPGGTAESGGTAGSGGAAASSTTGPHVVVVLTARTTDGSDPSPTDLGESADLLRGRVASIPGANVTEVPPRTLRLEAPGTDVTVFDKLLRRGVLTIRPVVSTWAPGAITSSPETTTSAQSAPPASTSPPTGFPPGSDPEVPTQPSADAPAGWSKWQAAAKRYASGGTPPSCRQIDRYQDLDDADKPLLTCDTDGSYGYLLDPTVIPGNAIDSASATQTTDVPGWVVDITFSITAQRAWATYTGEHIGTQIALTLDGQVLSAPQIVQQINGGRVQISGSFTQTEATDLAGWLAAGALPLAFGVDSRSVVG